MNRLLGWYLLVVAVAVGILFVATPLYMPVDDSEYVYPVWEIMNWFMGAALLIALWVTASSWRASKTGDQCCSSSCDCLLFGATITLALLYFHNWFATLRFNPPSDYELMLWSLIDTVFPVIVGAIGLQLIKKTA
ncbi:MAG: hypothetical protein OXI38_12450 [Bacteroidota bacterium]|nr:hypothetical protein [Bacteroidota bacterium]